MYIENFSSHVYATYAVIASGVGAQMQLYNPEITPLIVMACATGSLISAIGVWGALSDQRYIARKKVFHETGKLDLSETGERRLLEMSKIKNQKHKIDVVLGVLVAMLSGLGIGIFGTMALTVQDVSWLQWVKNPSALPFVGLVMSASGRALVEAFQKGILVRMFVKKYSDIDIGDIHK